MKFEYGLIFSTYSFNQIEGNRFRTGGRTSNAFSKWIEFNGYTAYGTLDKEFKYGIGFRAMLSKRNYKITPYRQRRFYTDELKIKTLRKSF